MFLLIKIFIPHKSLPKLIIVDLLQFLNKNLLFFIN